MNEEWIDFPSLADQLLELTPEQLNTLQEIYYILFREEMVP